MAKPKWTVVSSCTPLLAAWLMTGPAMAQSPQSAVSRQKVTVVGCVLRDSAYRPTRAVGNSSTEFLLVTPAKTSYGLIGTLERQLGQHVGRRVEIVGTIENDSRDSQQPTGGATDPVSGAGTPPGVPAPQRLNIVSVKLAAGAC